MTKQFGKSPFNQFLEGRQREMGYEWMKQQRAKKNQMLPKYLTTPLTGKPSATILKVWEDFNVDQANQKGLLIHVDFSYQSLPAQGGAIAAYFYLENDMPLRDLNGKYCSQSGHVCVERSFKPPILQSRYTDFQLFMPYDELHTGPGNYSLKFFVVIWKSPIRSSWILPNAVLACSQWVPVSYKELPPKRTKVKAKK